MDFEKSQITLAASPLVALPRAGNLAKSDDAQKMGLSEVISWNEIMAVSCGRHHFSRCGCAR
jgi:hypothetical protein